MEMGERSKINFDQEDLDQTKPCLRILLCSLSLCLSPGEGRPAVLWSGRTEKEAQEEEKASQ